MTEFALYIITAFMIGAIPFGYIVTRLSGSGDIRTQGSGNIGATNVWRVAGAAPGIFTLLLDFLKGFLVVSQSYASYFGIFSEFGPSIWSWLPLCSGLAVVLGHVYSPYLKFRGGKGVITAFGVLVSWIPFASIVGLGAFVVVVAVTRYISLGSLLGALALAGTVWFEYLRLPSGSPPVELYFATGVALLIVYTHRANIKRILSGTENRFSLKKKQEDS